MVHSLGVKRPEPESGHLSVPSAKVKSMVLYALFFTCFRTVRRDSLALNVTETCVICTVERDRERMYCLCIVHAKICLWVSQQRVTASVLLIRTICLFSEQHGRKKCVRLQMCRRS